MQPTLRIRVQSQATPWSQHLEAVSRLRLELDMTEAKNIGWFILTALAAALLGMAIIMFGARQ